MILLENNYLQKTLKWDKVFKNGPSKFRGMQPLKNLKRYGLPKETKALQIL